MEPLDFKTQMDNLGYYLFMETEEKKYQEEMRRRTESIDDENDNVPREKEEASIYSSK